MVETSKTKIKKSKKVTSSKVGTMWVVILIFIIAFLLLIIAYMIGRQSGKDSVNIAKQQYKSKNIKQAKENKLDKNLELDLIDNKNSDDIDNTIAKEVAEYTNENLDLTISEEKQKKILTNTIKQELVLSADMLVWQDKLIETTLFEGYYKKYYLADIKKGTFEGGKLNRVVIQGLGFPSVIYVELNNKIYFLPKESNFVGESYVDAFTKDKTFFVERNVSIPELEYDEEISFKYKGVNAYAVKYITPFSDNETISFEEDKLKKIDYRHPLYGQAWITDNKEGGGSIFSMNGIYFRGPVNTTYVYRLIPDVVSAKPKKNDAYTGDVLDITWDNGQKNTDTYTYGTNGCGISNFIAGISNKYYNDVVSSDLEKIGKTASNKIVYKLKSANHPIIQENFDKYNEIKDSEWMQEKIKSKTGKKTVDTIEEFHEMNSIIVFYDIFERKNVMLLSLFEEPAECGKPVIYLYPEKITDVNVKVAPTSGFTKVNPTYPEGGWNVRAYPSGQLFNYGDNETYSYLFWEGKSDTWYNQPKEGFVVSRDEIGYLFDKTLSAQNLNKQEISDFKEFWVPKMLESSKPYFFITYTTEDFVNRVAPLQVTPRPDTVIRVMMDYEPLDAQIQVEKMTFDPKERKGFTVIEWGGMLGK